MARVSTITGDQQVTGTLTANTLKGDLDRDQIVQRTLVKFPISFLDLRVHDALQTVLPGTAAADDLALIGGTFGTDQPQIETDDQKANGTPTSLRARTIVRLPAEYDDAETLQIRVRAGMETTISDTTATVDIEAWKIDEDGTVGASDLCATAAQSINNLTAADKDFTITATGLAPGDQLDVRITITIEDGATGTEVKGVINALHLLCDIRG